MSDNAGEGDVGSNAREGLQDSARDVSSPADVPSIGAVDSQNSAINDTEVIATGSSVASPPLSPIEKMEVRIDFEVGRVTLPISALANVSSGAVIEMPAVSLDKVIAKSGGQAFAHGEFVELGGRIGFRITKLVSGGAAT